MDRGIIRKRIAVTEYHGRCILSDIIKDLYIDTLGYPCTDCKMKSNCEFYAEKIKQLTNMEED